MTTVGMVSALISVDGVGLGRPICQEPNIAKDMLKGKISGAIVQKVDRDNFGLLITIAGAQIREIGKDQEPIDMSVQENVEAFMKDMGVWSKKMSSGNASIYGFLDIESAQTRPYGAVAA